MKFLIFLFSLLSFTAYADSYDAQLLQERVTLQKMSADANNNFATCIANGVKPKHCQQILASSSASICAMKAESRDMGTCMAAARPKKSNAGAYWLAAGKLALTAYLGGELFDAGVVLGIGEGLSALGNKNSIGGDGIIGDGNESLNATAPPFFPPAPAELETPEIPDVVIPDIEG